MVGFLIVIDTLTSLVLWDIKQKIKESLLSFLKEEMHLIIGGNITEESQALAD